MVGYYSNQKIKKVPGFLRQESSLLSFLQECLKVQLCFYTLDLHRKLGVGFAPVKLQHPTSDLQSCLRFPTITK